MRSFNPDIDIFDDPFSAYKAFKKCKVPCHLLEAQLWKGKVAWFLDRGLQALECWPDKYHKLMEK